MDNIKFTINEFNEMLKNDNNIKKAFNKLLEYEYSFSLSGKSLKDKIYSNITKEELKQNE